VLGPISHDVKDCTIEDRNSSLDMWFIIDRPLFFH